MDMERLWTVRDVMNVIPLGKTSCVAIINSLPHVSMGRKLMVEPRYIRHWIDTHTRSGNRPESIPCRPAKRKRHEDLGLTKDGLIPYRHTRKTV